MDIKLMKANLYPKRIEKPNSTEQAEMGWPLNFQRKPKNLPSHPCFSKCQYFRALDHDERQIRPLSAIYHELRSFLSCRHVEYLILEVEDFSV